MQQHLLYRKSQKLRLKIITNRGIDFITSVRNDATVSQLANRALKVYLELSKQVIAAKKQLTVSAVKQGIFHMPKSQVIHNLIHQDDVVEVVIVKAKPKYPNQLYNQQTKSTWSKNNILKNIIKQQNKEKSPEKIIPEIVQLQQEIKDCSIDQQNQEKQIVQKQEIAQVHNEIQNFLEKKKISKKQKKRRKMEEKIRKQIQKGININTLDKIPQTNTAKITIKASKKQKIQAPNQLKLTHSQDKLKVASSPKKIPIPSPKITFHVDPHIESPKISLIQLEKHVLNDFHLTEKKQKIEKVVSPKTIRKNSLTIKDDLKQFRIQQEIVEQKKQNIDQSQKKSKNQPQSQKKKITIIEAEDSDSDEDKKDNQHFVNDRQKQINQITNKIKAFNVDSDSQ